MAAGACALFMLCIGAWTMHHSRCWYLLLLLADSIDKGSTCQSRVQDLMVLLCLLCHNALDAACMPHLTAAALWSAAGNHLNRYICLTL